MIKTLKNLFKQDKEKFVVPKSVQSVIPIKTIWEDGVFLVGKNKYAKTFKFEDINYAVASREDKEAMFLEYSELLNALDSGATTKITINNRRLNKADFEQTILISMTIGTLCGYVLSNMLYNVGAFYIGLMPDHIMARVDEALAISLAMNGGQNERN